MCSAATRSTKAICCSISRRLPKGAHAPVAMPVATPRPELDELHARRALTTDAARPDMVRKRHAQGRRTARENIADLCDAGSFVEYGALAIAAQRAAASSTT